LINISHRDRLLLFGWLCIIF
jgi:hypothetical protein